MDICLYPRTNKSLKTTSKNIKSFLVFTNINNIYKNY